MDDLLDRFHEKLVLRLKKDFRVIMLKYLKLEVRFIYCLGSPEGKF